jgi:hypothetical protein
VLNPAMPTFARLSNIRTVKLPSSMLRRRPIARDPISTARMFSRAANTVLALSGPDGLIERSVRFPGRSCRDQRGTRRSCHVFDHARTSSCS